MKIELILHIGYPKTGTTSLQSTLYYLREWIFQKYNFYYPKTGIVNTNDTGHHLLTGTHPYCKGINLKKIWNDLFNEIQGVNASKVILSSEFFFYCKKFQGT